MAKQSARAPARWLALCLALLVQQAAAQSAVILCYHRFGPTAADSMTVRTALFAQQVARLRAEGYQFLPLRAVLDGLYRGAPLPDKAIALTIDDGHLSVYTELRPILQREQLPATLFIYPSAISNARYAMSWEQLREMQALPGVEIQSHTYWHPNFRIEKKRLAPAAYDAFVGKQLNQSRSALGKRLGATPDMLAWPFGLRDEALDHAAAAAGYQYAFTIDGRHARTGDNPYAIPRYLVAEARSAEGLLKRLRSSGERP